jgi:hypothetical protein
LPKSPGLMVWSGPCDKAEREMIGA